MAETTKRMGRPRSERARQAVLEAVDDLLVEVGYAGMTMKGIAERAGVGRQTVYRWWSTKAEILVEASAADIEDELAVAPQATVRMDLVAYLDALADFLARSPAGAAYRALIAAAQQDEAVATLVASRDVLGDSARAVIDRVAGGRAPAVPVEEATARLVGPMFFWVMSGRDPRQLDSGALADGFLRELRSARARGASG